MRDIGIRVQRQIGSRFTIQIVNLKNLITKLEEPKCIFTAICHIKESVFILVFLVNCRHQSSCNRKICQDKCLGIVSRPYVIIYFTYQLEAECFWQRQIWPFLHWDWSSFGQRKQIGQQSNQLGRDTYVTNVTEINNGPVGSTYT